MNVTGDEDEPSFMPKTGRVGSMVIVIGLGTFNHRGIPILWEFLCLNPCTSGPCPRRCRYSAAQLRRVWLWARRN